MAGELQTMLAVVHTRTSQCIVFSVPHAYIIYCLNKLLFTHRNHKPNKEVQERQKQYAYLSVTYR